ATALAPSARVAALSRAGIDVEIVAQDGCGRVSLPELLQRLGRRGVRSVLIEGGGCLITSALRARLVDRLVVCIAPKVLGAGIDAVGDLDIARLADALTFSSSHFTPLGEDVIFDGQLDRSGAGAGAHDGSADG